MTLLLFWHNYASKVTAPASITAERSFISRRAASLCKTGRPLVCEPNAAVLKCSHLAQRFAVSFTCADLFSTSFLPLRLNAPSAETSDDEKKKTVSNCGENCCVFFYSPNSLQEVLSQSEGWLLPLRSQNPFWQLLVCVRRCYSDSWAKEAVQLLWHSEPGTATVSTMFCSDIFRAKI